MDINNSEKSKQNNKKLIVPFIAISLVMVLLITGGLSYAYFVWYGTAPGATSATATDTYPTKCTRACSVSSSACTMTVTYAGMASSSYNTATPKFTSTCYINVSISGIAGTDKVTYWSANEMTYSLNGGTTNTNLFGVTAATELVASHALTVQGTAGTCNTSYENTTLTLKFWNLNKNQTPLLGTTNTAKTYTYYLYNPSLTCTIS